jgi:hypothetical protein
MITLKKEGLGFNRDDLIQLKIKKKLTAEQLEKADVKIDRLQEILRKKAAKSENLPRIPIERSTITNYGDSVEMFRLPPKYRKTLPVMKKDDTKVPDFPDNNERNREMRLSHIKKTVCKHLIDEVKEKKEAVRIRRERLKAPKKFPVERIGKSLLPDRYTRGELPCTIEHGTHGQYLSWACPLENLDYEYYLPMFFDGLQVKQAPISFLARQGVEDMLYASRSYPERVIPCVKYVAPLIRNALATYDHEIVLAVLKVIQQLITCTIGIGPALMNHARIILGPMAPFLSWRKNLGDKFDYSQRRRDDIAEEVRSTLELLEVHGGPKALETIKFCIPLCE